MIQVTRAERNYLEQNGCVFRRDLHKTVGTGRKTTYYATENDRVMSLLKKYKNEIRQN